MDCASETCDDAYATIKFLISDLMLRLLLPNNWLIQLFYIFVAFSIDHTAFVRMHAAVVLVDPIEANRWIRLWHWTYHFNFEPQRVTHTHTSCTHTAVNLKCSNRWNRFGWFDKINDNWLMRFDGLNATRRAHGTVSRLCNSHRI